MLLRKAESLVEELVKDTYVDKVREM